MAFESQKCTAIKTCAQDLGIRFSTVLCALWEVARDCRSNLFVPRNREHVRIELGHPFQQGSGHKGHSVGVAAHNARHRISYKSMCQSASVARSEMWRTKCELLSIVTSNGTFRALAEAFGAQSLNCWLQRRYSCKVETWSINAIIGISLTSQFRPSILEALHLRLNSCSDLRGFLLVTDLFHTGLSLQQGFSCDKNDEPLII